MHLQHELPSTVLYIIKHSHYSFSFFEMKSDDFVIYCLAWHKKRQCCRLLIAYLMETSLHHLMQVAILSVYTGAQSPRVECRVRREAGGKCIPGLDRRVGMNGVDKFLFFSQEIQSRLICVRNMFRAVFP